MTQSDFETIVLNVLGEPLQPCCFEPKTGFYRDGYCHTGAHDTGKHIVCAKMTEAFLAFTQEQGNDLSTPRPDYDFPGLKAGDRWCLCVMRWKEALEADCAPLVVLASCHENALKHVTLDTLKTHATHGMH